MNIATTIIVSILTASITIILVDYMKDRKWRKAEQITSYDDRIEIIQSIAINSFFSFVLAIGIASLNVENHYKALFIVLMAISIVFFTYTHLRFHKSFLTKIYQSKESRCEFIRISLFILIVWISVLIAIFQTKYFGSIPLLLTLAFYIILFWLNQYFKWGITRRYNKIIVVTIDGDVYESIELISLDDCKIIYESKSDKRVIIPNHQIKLIEYEYKITTVADFIDKEH